MKIINKSRSFLKASVVIIIALAFVMPSSGIMEKTNLRNNSVPEYHITVAEAKELIENQKSLLLNVQEEGTSQNIDSAIPITLEDLACGSCFEKKLNNYEIFIVYSENSALRNKASELLKENGYTVYELIETPTSDDFSLIYNLSDSNNEYDEIVFPSEILANEGHRDIQLYNSNVQVSAYERYGRIKRLYGEAFSNGASPQESADAFIQANAYLFGVNPSDLEFNHLQPIMYDQDTGEYEFTGVNYDQYKNDIPVFRSRLILLVRNEDNYPLVLASVDLRDLNGFEPETGRATPDIGFENALKASPNLWKFTQPEMIIWAGIDDMITNPVLAFSFVGDNGVPVDGSNPEKQLFVTDAISGEILYEENLILFVDVIGNVKGNATQGVGAEHCEPEIATNLPYSRVNIGGTVAFADENGDFIIPNGGSSEITVESRLRGLWFRVFNQAGADTVLSQLVTPPGPANFIQNELNNDEFKRAEVNGYLQANIVRDFTLTYNPAYPGLQQNEFPVNVNDNTGYCPGNAWYDGYSITFCRSGSGYPNTAWSTVIHHEYGHHLVQEAGSGQGPYGEGMGDVMGLLITDNSGIGYGFFGDCNQPLREANNTLQYPCSGEIHFCGKLISGCIWSTRNELAITNPSNYTDILANLAINSMLIHTGSSIDPSITIDYLVLDDDDDNIYNGAPHYAEIAAGFGAHNMDAPVLALLLFSFPDGLPETILPAGGTTLRVVVNQSISLPESDTGLMYFNDGSGWSEIPMTMVEPHVYDVIFLEAECGEQVSFYFSAETTDGEIQLWPIGAPDELFSAVAALSVEVEFSDDFEDDLGWVVIDDPSLTAGAWERGIPVGGGGRGDPPTDYDGSGKCYLTGNAYGNSDVDDGTTWLISPSIDISDGIDANIHYALWYTNNFGDDPNNDLFKVYLSNDDGNSWILVETIGPVSYPGWYEYDMMVSDFCIPTGEVKVRFEVSDLGGGSVVEAGVDDFRALTYHCSENPAVPDVECEGSLSWIDVKLGEIVTGSFTVENIGEPDSWLDWEVTELPTWGNWTFTPSCGDNLKPEDDAVTVEVSVVAPDEQNEEFTGELKIENEDDSSDYCIIEISLSTPMDQNSGNSRIVLEFIERLFQRFPALKQSLSLLPIFDRLLVN